MKRHAKKTESKNTDHPDRDKKLRSILLGLGIAVFLYAIFGVFTSVIPNRFFVRMTPAGLLEQSSLLITSLLLGAYISLLYYGRSVKKEKICNTTAASGGIFGFLTFGCSVCNKILVFFLGIAGVLAYFDPIKPVLGILSIIFLGYAVFVKAKSMSLV